MRLNPLNIILNPDFEFNKKIYFISGNETTLIENIKWKIIEHYKKSKNVSLEYIDSIYDFNDTAGLFGENKIYLVNNHKGMEEEKLSKIKNTDSIFIFVQENSAKIKKLKAILTKDIEIYLIDCYELDKNAKSRILNEFFKLSQTAIGQEIYWFLVEKLDNRYGFLQDSLNKILVLDQEDITFKNIKKILAISDNGKEKLFFFLFNKNAEIVSAYREKIIVSADVNELYYYCKYFCQLIIDSKNEEEYNKKIPVYLFKEKKFLIDFYKRYNFKKKRLLMRLLSSTEKTLRKESGLSLVSGLRFLLSIKKITVS